MTNLRKILEEVLLDVNNTETRPNWNKRIDLAHQQILALIPKRKDVIFMEDFKCGGCGVCAGCEHYLNSGEREQNIENNGFNKAIDIMEQSMTKEE